MRLITGCPRSGTNYITSVLQEIGVDARHETLGDWEGEVIVAWQIAADVQVKRCLQTPSPRSPNLFRAPIDDVILHQVRHPLNVIGSCHTLHDSSWNFICSQIPCSMSDSLMLRSMRLWFHWNLLAEARSVFRYQVEKVGFVLGQVCQHLSLPIRSFPTTEIPESAKKHRDHPALRWGDLEDIDSELTSRIMDMACRYGYGVPK